MPFISLQAGFSTCHLCELNLDFKSLEMAFRLLNIYFCLARHILWVEAVSCACWGQLLWSKNGLGHALFLLVNRRRPRDLQKLLHWNHSNRHADARDKLVALGLAYLIFMLYTDVNSRCLLLHCEMRSQYEMSSPWVILILPHFFLFISCGCRWAFQAGTTALLPSTVSPHVHVAQPAGDSSYIDV